MSRRTDCFADSQVRCHGDLLTTPGLCRDQRQHNNTNSRARHDQHNSPADEEDGHKNGVHESLIFLDDESIPVRRMKPSKCQSSPESKILCQ
jgi:hypothetical protein